MTHTTLDALKDALSATSEPLRALILAFVVVLLRESVPTLQDAPLEAVLAPLIGYMIAKGLGQAKLGPAIDVKPAILPAEDIERYLKQRH